MQISSYTELTNYKEKKNFMSTAVLHTVIYLLDQVNVKHLSSLFQAHELLNLPLFLRSFALEKEGLEFFYIESQFYAEIFRLLITITSPFFFPHVKQQRA